MRHFRPPGCTAHGCGAAAGPLRTLQLALEDMTTAPALSRWLAALQWRWGMALTESPPVQ